MKKSGTSISIVVLLVAICGTAVAQQAERATPAAALTLTPLVLVNGWVGGVFSTATPAVSKVGGVVHFRGAMGNGTSSQAFTLPAGFRPGHIAYVPVDMCNATNGRLIISTNGVTSVQAESSFSNAQCFTSLDGASFIP